MKIIAPVTSIALVVLVPLFIRLAFNVIKKRKAHQVALGSGQHSDLEAAIRAHGNFAEYVPLVLLLMLVAELNGAPWWLVAVNAVLLVTGRLIHAAAIPAGNISKRVQGMKLTFASLVVGSVANVVPLVLSSLN